jgi:hypothetical protein
MANSVANGYTINSARSTGLRTPGNSTSADQLDQAKCRLGIAAYWLEIFCMVPESNDHSPPNFCRVSTKP